MDGRRETKPTPAEQRSGDRGGHEKEAGLEGSLSEVCLGGQGEGGQSRQQASGRE